MLQAIPTRGKREDEQVNVQTLFNLISRNVSLINLLLRYSKDVLNNLCPNTISVESMKSYRNDFC